MRTFQELIVTWPKGITGFSRDVGIGYQAARKMKERGNVRHQYWSAILRAAQQRSIPLSADDLLRFSRAHSRGRRERNARGSPRAAA